MSTVPQFVVEHLNEKREDIQALALTMKDLVAEFRSIERFAGVPSADLGFVFGAPDSYVKASEPVKTKTDGFGHRETKLTTAETKRKFGYLLKLKGDARVAEVGRIHREMPEVNKQHLSRSLGKSSSWFSNYASRAKHKGML